MSNGARHAWGLLAGVVLTAALAGLLVYGTYRLTHGLGMPHGKQDKWIGAGLLGGAAVVFALLASSRLSPLGTLIGGVLFTAAGVLYLVSKPTAVDLINKIPFRSERFTVAALGETGVVLFAGVGLLFSSLFPSRWRPAEADEIGYEYGLPDQPVSQPYTQGGGRHAARQERQPAHEGAGRTTDFDVPLYEPPRQREYGRAPFSPSEESPGGTQEIRRPE